MPLNVATLTTAVLRLTDKSRGDFAGWPTVVVGGAVDWAATSQAAASNWAGAAQAYFMELVVPAVVPAAHTAGASAFAAAMTPKVSTDPLGGVADGFGAYAVVLAVSAVVPVAVPPPAPLVLVPGPPTSDATGPAAAMAATIDTWARTGLYGVPPAVPAVPWS